MCRYILLGLLRAGTAQHGYGLIKAYRSRSGLDVNSGTVYRELRRLQADNLIRAANSPAGRRPRAPYEITEAGHAAFETWLRRAALQANRKYDNTLVHKAMFLSSARDSVALRLIDRWQDELWIECKVVERARREALEEAKAHPTSFSPLPLLLARRLRYLEAESEFLETVRAAYHKWKVRSARAGARKRGGKLVEGRVAKRSSVQKADSVIPASPGRKPPARKSWAANPEEEKTRAGSP